MSFNASPSSISASMNMILEHKDVHNLEDADPATIESSASYQLQCEKEMISSTHIDVGTTNHSFHEEYDHAETDEVFITSWCRNDEGEDSIQALRRRPSISKLVHSETQSSSTASTGDDGDLLLEDLTQPSRMPVPRYPSSVEEDERIHLGLHHYTLDSSHTPYENQHDGEFDSQSQGELSQEIIVLDLQYLCGSGEMSGSSSGYSDSDPTSPSMSSDRSTSLGLDGRDPLQHDHQEPSDALPASRRDTLQSPRRGQEPTLFPDGRPNRTQSSTDKNVSSVPSSHSPTAAHPPARTRVQTPSTVDRAGASALMEQRETETRTAAPHSVTSSSREPQEDNARPFEGPKESWSDEGAASAVVQGNANQKNPGSPSTKQKMDMPSQDRALPPSDRSRGTPTTGTSVPPAPKPEDEHGIFQHTSADASGSLQPHLWSPTPPTDDCNFLVDYDHMETHQQQDHPQSQGTTAVGKGATSTPSNSSTSIRLSSIDKVADGSGSNAVPCLPKISLPLPSAAVNSSSLQHAAQGGSSSVAPSNWHPLAYPVHHQDPGSSISPSLSHHRAAAAVPAASQNQEQIYQHQYTQIGYFDSSTVPPSDTGLQSSLTAGHHCPSPAAASHDNYTRLSHVQHVLAHAHLIRTAAMAHTPSNPPHMDQAANTTAMLEHSGGPGKASTASHHEKSTMASSSYWATSCAAPGYVPPPLGCGHPHYGCNATGCSVPFAATEGSMRGCNAQHLPSMEGSHPNTTVVRHGPWSAPSTPSGFSHPNLYHRGPSDAAMPQAPVTYNMNSMGATHGPDGAKEGALISRYHNQRNSSANYGYTRVDGENGGGGSFSSSRGALALQGPLFNPGPSEHGGYGYGHPFVYDGRTDSHHAMVPSSLSRGTAGGLQAHPSASDPSSSATGPHLSLAVEVRSKFEPVDAVTLYSRPRSRAMIEDGTYRDPEPKHCTNCMTMNTPSWRRCPEGRRLLCNACGLFEKLHGRPRPTYQAKDGSIKIQRTVLPHDPCVRCGRRESPQWFRSPDKELICNACNEISKQQRAMGSISPPALIGAPSGSSKQQQSTTGPKQNKPVSSKRKRKTATATLTESSASGGAVGSIGATHAALATPGSMRLQAEASFPSSILPPSAAMLVSPDLGFSASGNGNFTRSVTWPSTMYRNGNTAGVGSAHDHQQYPYGSSNALTYPNVAAAAAAAYCYQNQFPYLANSAAATSSSTAGVESGSFLGWQSATGAALSSSARMQEPVSDATLYSSTGHPSMYTTMANVNGGTTVPSSYLPMIRTNGPGTNAMVSGIGPLPPMSSIGSGIGVSTAAGFLRHDDGISPSVVVGGGISGASGPGGQPEGQHSSKDVFSATGPSADGPSSTPGFPSSAMAPPTTAGGSGGPSEVQIKTEDEGRDVNSKRRMLNNDASFSASPMAARSHVAMKRSRGSSEQTAVRPPSAAAAQKTAAARNSRYNKTSSSARAAVNPTGPLEKKKPHQHQQLLSPQNMRGHGERAGRSDARRGGEKRLGEDDHEVLVGSATERDDGHGRYRSGPISAVPATTNALPLAFPGPRQNTPASDSSSSGHRSQSSSASSGGSLDEDDVEADDEGDAVRLAPSVKRLGSARVPRDSHGTMSTNDRQDHIGSGSKARLDSHQQEKLVLRIPTGITGAETYSGSRGAGNEDASSRSVGGSAAQWPTKRSEK